MNTNNNMNQIECKMDVNLKGLFSDMMMMMQVKDRSLRFRHHDGEIYPRSKLSLTSIMYHKVKSYKRKKKSLKPFGRSFQLPTRS